MFGCPLEGPLWVVRYQKAALFSLFEQHGLVVEEFGHHAGGHCNKSEIYLRKRTQLTAHNGHT